jgi:hypothetical protein
MILALQESHASAVQQAEIFLGWLGTVGSALAMPSNSARRRRSRKSVMADANALFNDLHYHANKWRHRFTSEIEKV